MPANISLNTLGTTWGVNGGGTSLSEFHGKQKWNTSSYLLSFFPTSGQIKFSDFDGFTYAVSTLILLHGQGFGSNNVYFNNGRTFTNIGTSSDGTYYYVSITGGSAPISGVHAYGIGNTFLQSYSWQDQTGGVYAAAHLATNGLLHHWRIFG